MEGFETYRGLMFSIAYRMLGSAMEAEDIVQEAYLRLRQTPAEQVRSPKSLMGTVVTRLCLDRMKSAQAQRESYIGPWLPEPVLTRETPLHEPEREAELADSISMAFMVLLESLSPLERAVFLLREVFDYDYAEVARIVGRDEAACRQLFSRAKKHVTEGRPRYHTTPEEHNRLLGSFLQAVTTGDVDGLTRLLSESVTLWSDGGGKVSSARRPIHGRDAVARFMIGLQRFATPDMSLESVEINGQTGFVLREADGTIIVVMTFETGDGAIQALRFIRNPDKLTRI
jgi:RNA polymerase sigma-70 factor (ECF subfamily)